MNPFRRPWIATSVGAALGVMFFTLTMVVLNSFDDPPGVDGYFYLKQILSLSQHHTLYFKDRSLAFVLPVALNVLLNDELLSFRLSIALVMGAFLFLQWQLVKEIMAQAMPREKWLALTAVALGVIFNFAFIEIGVSYLKTITALTFVLASLRTLWSIQQESQSPNTMPIVRYWKPVLFSVLALLSHKSALLMLGLIGVAWAIQQRRGKTVVAIGVGGLIAGLVFVSIFSQSVPYLKHLAAGFEFLPVPHWNWARELVRDHNLIHISMAGAVIYLISYFFVRQKLCSSDRFLGDFLTLFALVTWLPIHQAGHEQPVYRIMLAYSAMALPLTLGFLIKSRVSFAAGIIIGLQMAQFAFSRPIFSLIPRYSQMNEEIMQIKNHVNESDHLICHHGLEFYVDYKTNIRCQIFLSTNTDQRQFRMVYAPSQVAWMRTRIHTEPKAILKVNQDYLLLAEQDWQKISADLNLRPNWRNPSAQRPDHIYAP